MCRRQKMGGIVALDWEWNERNKWLLFHINVWFWPVDASVSNDLMLWKVQSKKIIISRYCSATSLENPFISDVFCTFSFNYLSWDPHRSTYGEIPASGRKASPQRKCPRLWPKPGRLTWPAPRSPARTRNTPAERALERCRWHPGPPGTRESRMSGAPSPDRWRRQRASSEASSRGPTSLSYGSHLRHMKRWRRGKRHVVTCFKPAAEPQEWILSVLWIIYGLTGVPLGEISVCQTCIF